jgi:hypothetical protein
MTSDTVRSWLTAIPAGSERHFPLPDDGTQAFSANLTHLNSTALAMPWHNGMQFPFWHATLTPVSWAILMKNLYNM